jgi:hypothetical protein
LLRLIILSLMSFDKVWGGNLLWRLELWTSYLVIVPPLLHPTPFQLLVASVSSTCLLCLVELIQLVRTSNTPFFSCAKRH